MSFTLIAGILGTSFLLLYFTFNLEMKDHPLLRFILVMFAFIFILLIPKVLLDSQTTCSAVMANATVMGNVTTYGYAPYCVEQAGTTSTTFMKIVYWLFRIFVAYIILYLFFTGINELRALYKGGKL